uniref:Exocyst complex component 7 n=1 Tax=Glossina morsitans morsitans TaxID=37546 RepID=A0A1B0FPI7_GLOMM
MEECRTPTLQCCHEFKFNNSPFNSCLQEAQIFNKMWCSTPKDMNMSTFELQTSMISPLEGLNKSTFSLSPKFSPVASTSNNLSPEYASHHSLIKSILNSNITVHLLLKYVGLEAYADYFEKCGIDINDFMKLKRHDLQKLGIMEEVDCDRIEKFLEDLNCKLRFMKIVKSRHTGRPEVKKNTSARLQHIFERKANKLYLKATQTLEQSTGISIKKATSHSDHLSSEEFADGDQELDKYLVMLLGLQRLLNWERALMQEIIPNSKHADVFAKLAYKSIDMVVKDAEAITNRIMRCISRKEWTSALGIFSALKRVILLQPDIDRTYDVQQREQLTKVLNKLQYTSYFLDVVRGESSTNIVGMSSSTLGYVNVPKDATVHELTSNTIWFIEHLCDHYDVIGAILQPDVLYSTQLDTILMKKSLPEEDRNKALLAIYIKKALAELNLSIMNKCEQYNDQATKHLFRLNNINYILNSLITSNLIDIVTMAEPDCRNSYIETIKELKCSYQKTWAKMLANISPLEELPKPAQGKVKDKDRSILKERFLTFNKDFEEACKIQRSISIPDVTLRQGIKRDNEEHILPKYNEFFKMYAAVQFSKNPEKYVKYKPHEIKAMLSKLFDDSA